MTARGAVLLPVAPFVFPVVVANAEFPCGKKLDRTALIFLGRLI